METKSRKTRILLLVMAFVLLALTACSNNTVSISSGTTPTTSSTEAAESTSTPDNSAQQTPENNEYGIHFFVVPTMTEEQQTYYIDYVQKLVYSGLLRKDWSADDYSSIAAEPDEAVTGSYLIFAFEDIIGTDEIQKLFQQYNGEFPAEVIEDVLLKHFPFTTEQLHEILSYHYKDDTNTYYYDGGRGGGPIEAAVVNINKGSDNEQGLVRLDYEIYTGYSGLDYTPDSYLYKTPGVLTLKQNADGRYIYLSVNVGEEIEAPQQQYSGEEQQFLSISLSGTVNGSPVEKTFTSPTEINKISNLILDQKMLEDTEGLEVPENVITATVQDGPGTNFKLTLFPATVPVLNEDVLVIQGELFAFYTDIQVYKDIMGLLTE